MKHRPSPPTFLLNRLRLKRRNTSVLCFASLTNSGSSEEESVGRRLLPPAPTTPKLRSQLVPPPSQRADACKSKFQWSRQVFKKRKTVNEDGAEKAHPTPSIDKPRTLCLESTAIDEEVPLLNYIEIYGKWNRRMLSPMELNIEPTPSNESRVVY